MRINIILFILIFLFSGCQSAQDRLYVKLSKGDEKQKIYKGHYKEVKTEEKKEKKDKKKDNHEIGLASWYGTKSKKNTFHGKKTANGDKFNTDNLSAAHRNLPIPSMAKVTNLENGKSVIVLINDRGPYHKGRVLDVSSKVASLLNFKNKGVAKVKIEPLELETKELHDKLQLKPLHGAKPKGKIVDPKCSINCFVKLMNIKHGYEIGK